MYEKASDGKPIRIFCRLSAPEVTPGTTRVRTAASKKIARFILRPLGVGCLRRAAIFPALACDPERLRLRQTLQSKEINRIAAQEPFFLRQSQIFTIHYVFYRVGKMAIPMAVVRRVNNGLFSVGREDAIEPSLFRFAGEDDLLAHDDLARLAFQFRHLRRQLLDVFVETFRPEGEPACASFHETDLQPGI